MKAVSVLPFLLFVVAGPTAVVVAQSSGTFSATGSMTTARAGHTATLLPNGKVLIAGGSGSVSAELYDPSPGSFTATGDMTIGRSGHTATLLPDGRVLITGGGSPNAPSNSLASAELYDPVTGGFTATGDMTVGRSGHTATLLRDGRVLITGGWSPNAPSYSLASAELYDPVTRAFTATGDVNVAWFGQTATLLADGTALIAVPTGGLFAGGSLASGELYDPSTGTFAHKGERTLGFDYWHTASLLMNGSVLISGGGDPDSGDTVVGAEIYDPSKGIFASAGSMRRCRFLHTATLLPDGTTLLAGGDGRYCPGNVFLAGTLSSAELYDPSTGAFALTGSMTAGRQNHAATLLNDGEILITGGFYWGGFQSPIDIARSAELYRPAVLKPSPVLFSLSGDGQGQGAIQHANTIRIASPSDPAVAGEYLSIYLIGLADGSIIPPQVSIGGRLAEITFFGNVPGYPGLNVINVRMPNGVAPGPAVPVRLTYLSRPSNAVIIGVR